jgi:hypothetical protein
MPLFLLLAARLPLPSCVLLVLDGSPAIIFFELASSPLFFLDGRLHPPSFRLFSLSELILVFLSFVDKPGGFFLPPLLFSFVLLIFSLPFLDFFFGLALGLVFSRLSLSLHLQLPFLPLSFHLFLECLSLALLHAGESL